MINHLDLGRRFHLHMVLDDLLSKPPQALVGMLQDKDGRALEPHEIQAHALILKARGRTVLALGCDHLDATGRCMGHPILPAPGGS